MAKTWEDTKADFFIEIDYKKDSENPSRVFRAMTELIETFQFLDRMLIKSIDVKIEPIMLLEDIETGSVKTWLNTVLKRIPDDAVYHMDWKPIVGQYLLKAKTLIVTWTEGKTTITNVTEIKPLREQITLLAKETNVRMMPDYQEISNRELLMGIQRISENTQHLAKGDEACYTTKLGGEAKFNLDLYITPESVNELLASETIQSENEMILKVKKPDFLGESKWDCRHGNRVIPITIADDDWLKQFQERTVTIQPGDSIRAKVQIIDSYDENRDLIETQYVADKVLEVIPMEKGQQSTFLPPNESN